MSVQFGEALGKKTIKELSSMQPGDVPDIYANVEDLIKQFDYKPATTIQDGIKHFTDWYRNYYQV
jgi:UDP-glucuronate 4-epimerase